MAERRSYVFSPEQMDDIPVVLYEGTVTLSDVELPDGSIQEDAITRSAALKKGDLVKFYSDSANPGVIQVEKVTLGSNEVNDAVGIISDNPVGADDGVTASSGTPVLAQRRVATIKAFGARIDEFDVTAAGAIRAQYAVSYSEAAAGVIEGSATLANGNMIATAYTAASGIVPVLMGYYGYHPAD